MNISEMTIDEIEQYVNETKSKICEIKMPYTIGKKYLIRTVTMIFTGKLEKAYPGELVITNAAWIAETERWADSCAKGIFKVVEPYPVDAKVIVNRSSIIDAVEVSWELPTKQK